MSFVVTQGIVKAVNSLIKPFVITTKRSCPLSVAVGLGLGWTPVPYKGDHVKVPQPGRSPASGQATSIRQKNKKS